jgi:hypothetical protein
MERDASAGNWIADISGRGATLGRLPKNVRFLGATQTQIDQPSTGMYEFEVVTGNAAYREGERFYLTPAQARRAYHIVH